MSATRWQEPNLSRAPFVNERPVRRLAVTLWLLFAITAFAGLWMSQTIRRETGTRLAELVRLNAGTVAARERATALEAELRRADLPAQNVRTEFLNRRIAERSFSWNRLLETLTQELPRGVRLMRLSPQGFTRERGRARTVNPTAATTRVALKITGEAEETEALLEFVDRLFKHPAFDHPNLSRESGKKDFKIQFELSVDYLPQLAEPGPTAAATAATTATPETAGSARTAVVAPGAPAYAPQAAAGASPAAKPRLPMPRAGAVPGGHDKAAAGAAGEPAGATEFADDQPEPQSARRGAGIGGSAGSGETGRAGVVPAAPFPGRGGSGGGSQPGFPGAPAAQPGTDGKFPFNVLPTALKPYASSTGRRP